MLDDKDEVVRGISKMCRVDVSEVTASLFSDGEIASEYMPALTTPRLSSAKRVPVLAEKTRKSVPWPVR